MNIGPPRELHAFVLDITYWESIGYSNSLV